MDPKAKKILLIGIGSFLVLILAGVLVSLLLRPQTASLNRVFLASPARIYSPVTNGRVRFFNGRNFIEYDIKTSQTKQLLTDSLYPSMEVVDWSEDSKLVLVYANFYRPNDYFGRLIKAQKSTDTANLWVINLESGKPTKLSAGYDRGTFSTDSNTVYAFQSSSPVDGESDQAQEIKGFSTRTGATTITIKSDQPVDRIIDIDGKVYAVVSSETDNNAHLYSVNQGGIDKNVELVPSFNDINAGSFGLAVYRTQSTTVSNQNLDPRNESEGSVGVLEIYDKNLNSVALFKDINGDYAIGSNREYVIVGSTESENYVLHNYSFATDKSEKFIIKSESDEETTMPESPAKLMLDGQNGLVSLTTAGLSVIDLKEKVYQPIAFDFDKFYTLDEKVGGSRGYIAIQEHDNLVVRLYADFQKVMIELNQKIRAQGIDPNTIDMVFSEE